jgi:DNA transformation protein and related proteins
MTQHDDFSTLKNIGKKTAQWLHDAGINMIEDLFALGAVEAWKRVKEVHREMTLVGLYALQGAILDVHWNSLPPDMKDELRAQLAEWL